MKRKGENMAKDKHIEDNFADMLAMLRKKCRKRMKRLKGYGKRIRN